MPSIQLDLSRLYGFKILANVAGTKAGPKVGDKVGSKLGNKAGVKVP